MTHTPHHIAITGGIGTGKSYVARLLAARGISVYDCDSAAKRLMDSEERLKQELKALVGTGTYTPEGRLRRDVLATFLLKSEANKQAVNNVVHPAVAQDFLRSGMTWLESAILFDSNFHTRVPFDMIVCVCAPLEVRLQRIMQRDNISRESAMQWIGRQMPQEEVARRSHVIIQNDGLTPLDSQINQLLRQAENI